MEKRNLLNALTVEDIWELVVENPSTVGPDAPFSELLEKIVEDTRTRHVYVIDEQRRLLGVVRMNTVTGLLFPIQSLSDPHMFGRVTLGGKTVREIMNDDPQSVRLDTPLHDMARILLQEKITELPVVDERNRLIGQVNVYEIVKTYLQVRQT